MAPVYGISIFQLRSQTSSKSIDVGDNPPCKQKYLLSINAANGRKSNKSVNNFQELIFPYF